MLLCAAFEPIGAFVTANCPVFIEALPKATSGWVLLKPNNGVDDLPVALIGLAIVAPVIGVVKLAAAELTDNLPEPDRLLPWVCCGISVIVSVCAGAPPISPRTLLVIPLPAAPVPMATLLLRSGSIKVLTPFPP